MRHILGFLLGVLLVPGLLYGAGWGFARAIGAIDVPAHKIDDRQQLYGALALLAAVGLVMGIVILARWASPLVSLVPALALIGLTVFFLVSPDGALDLPGRVPPKGDQPDDLDTALRNLLATGIFGLMGLALLMPTWAPRRWRGDDDGAAAYY